MTSLPHHDLVIGVGVVQLSLAKQFVADTSVLPHIIMLNTTGSHVLEILNIERFSITPFRVRMAPLRCTLQRQLGL